MEGQLEGSGLSQLLHHPLEGFMKLILDRASKGNSSLAGMGGLFRDPRTNTTLIYANHCGYASNNEANFFATRQGLQMEIRMGYKNILVEGDSRLVINTVKKLNQGTKWEKLSHSWRITRLIQEIGNLLINFNYTMTPHKKG